jgi:hypothetical protein
MRESIRFERVGGRWSEQICELGLQSHLGFHRNDVLFYDRERCDICDPHICLDAVAAPFMRLTVSYAGRDGARAHMSAEPPTPE